VVDTLCPWCGAYSKRQCELKEEMGVCPWEESEPDPDRLREDRDERDALDDADDLVQSWMDRGRE